MPAPAKAPGAAAADLQAERSAVNEWRTKRVNSLTSDSGWLTLAGLFWLREGENTFGRDPKSSLALDNPALAENAGSFEVNGHKVRFVGRPQSGVTHQGKPVTTLDLAFDATEEPTVLESGSLRFFVIDAVDVARQHGMGGRINTVVLEGTRNGSPTSVTTTGDSISTSTGPSYSVPNAPRSRSGGSEKTIHRQCSLAMTCSMSADRPSRRMPGGICGMATSPRSIR